MSLTVGVAVWIQEPAVIGYWDCCLDTGTDLLLIIGDAIWIWGPTVVIDSWGTGRNRKHFPLDRRWSPHQAFSL